jgi:hypothetical protein
MMRDLNGDGWPDIYVCNDFKSPDRIWLNDGAGRFRAIVARPFAKLRFRRGRCRGHQSGQSFDLFVANMLSRGHGHRLTQRPNMLPDSIASGDVVNRVQAPHNTLLLSRRRRQLFEIAQFAGVEATGGPGRRSSSTSIWMDSRTCWWQ